MFISNIKPEHLIQEAMLAMLYYNYTMYIRVYIIKQL